MEQDVRPVILAIDDDPVTLNMAVAILKKDYRLRPFAFPAMAFKYLGLAGAKVHLALLDYQMPLISGPEVFRQLKQYPATADVPVIFMTGQTDKATEEELLAAGAAGVIPKPPVASDLLGIVQTAIKLNRSNINV